MRRRRGEAPLYTNEWKIQVLKVGKAFGATSIALRGTSRWHIAWSQRNTGCLWQNTMNVGTSTWLGDSCALDTGLRAVGDPTLVYSYYWNELQYFRPE